MGDDTLYGDAGNDRIDGGYGNDHASRRRRRRHHHRSRRRRQHPGRRRQRRHPGRQRLNLILGGFGKRLHRHRRGRLDEAFGGQGNDFILGSKANEQDIGNEGDDWIESGTSDGAPGDNFDPLGNDPVIGNDVFIGGGENDKFIGEGGDDIMVGSLGLDDRYIGGSGFDWATFKDDTIGVTIDIDDRFFDQPPVPGSGASALARFDIIEGLSGSALRRRPVRRQRRRRSLCATVGGAQGSALTNIALINGLQEFLDTRARDARHVFDGGNIILGGDGSDIMRAAAATT